MIRLADAKDYDAILRMAQSFHEKSPLSDVPFELKKFNELFNAYLRGNRTEFIIILIEDEEGPYGCIVGAVHPLIFSSEKVASEVIWWVDPGKRGSKESLLLFLAFEEWGKKIGAVYSQMAMLPEVTNLEKFYTKHGYKEMERSYVKRI